MIKRESTSEASDTSAEMKEDTSFVKSESIPTDVYTAAAEDLTKQEPDSQLYTEKVIFTKNNMYVCVINLHYSNIVTIM